MTVLGVAWNGSDGAMQDFEDRHGLTFPSLRDDTGAVFASFGVPGQPAWVFVSGDGTTDTVLGVVPPEELAQRLDNLG